MTETFPVFVFNRFHLESA